MTMQRTTNPREAARAGNGWMDWLSGTWERLQGRTGGSEVGERAARSRRGNRRAGAARSGWDDLVRQRREDADPHDLRIYGEMRRTFPVLDVAVTRLVQLCGTPRIVAAPSVQAELEGWLAHVSTAPGQRGIQGWLETHLDQLLVYGRAVGEITLAPSRREVLALGGVDPFAVTLTRGAAPHSLRVWRRPAGFQRAEELPASLTLVSLRAPQDGADGVVTGTSMLRSLRFVAEACSLIENTTAQVWQRVGCPSFHVNWNPDASFSDPQGTQSDEILEGLQTSFTDMMTARRRGEIRDFFTSGKVEVSIVGREGQILAVQEHLRVFMEQMVAVTGMPPWLLGLHWSTTERLSVQQADLLVANVEAIRREVQPQLEYLVDLRQRLRGIRGAVRLEWPAVNLRDATEQARADAWWEQARQRRIENARRMWELGFWSQDRAAREADETVAAAHRPLDAPPGTAASLASHVSPPD